MYDSHDPHIPVGFSRLQRIFPASLMDDLRPADWFCHGDQEVGHLTKPFRKGEVNQVNSPKLWKNRRKMVI